MRDARMLSLALMIFTSSAYASDGHHGQMQDAPVLHKIDEPHRKVEKPLGAVVAMDAEHARSYHIDELITAGAEPLTLLSRSKLRAELSPRAVVTFDEKGFRILRGSAVVEQNEETSVRTPGAKVEFVGKAVISYDHREKSSSAFVLEGEARMVNPHQSENTLRLSRFRGATMVVGEVLPQLVRQLDIGEVQAWLKGFSWPEARRTAFLKNMPGEKILAESEAPEHLKEAKIEDYFSSIDTADEQQQPEYYRKKFDDPDKVVAEANSKQGAGKALSPEEAALISLPKTKIDLGFDLGPEFLSSEQKAEELAKVPQVKAVAQRGPASVVRAEQPKAVKSKKPTAVQGDPEVNFVLERLRQVRSGNAVSSRVPASQRAPASAQETVVPDPVYDYSQNF